MRKQKTRSNNQELLFPLPERPSEPEEIRFEQSEHPVWTENKAKLIEEYLYLFVLVTRAHFKTLRKTIMKQAILKKAS